MDKGATVLGIAKESDVTQRLNSTNRRYTGSASESCPRSARKGLLLMGHAGDSLGLPLLPLGLCVRLRGPGWAESRCSWSLDPEDMGKWVHLLVIA